MRRHNGKRSKMDGLVERWRRGLPALMAYFYNIRGLVTDPKGWRLHLRRLLSCLREFTSALLD